MLRNPKRPIFNFSSNYVSTHNNNFKSFSDFRDSWEISDEILNDFFTYLNNDSINVVKDSLMIDQKFLKNRIKSEIAGSIWGKDEATNIRLLKDNQIIESLKHFHEADAFLKSMN